METHYRTQMRRFWLLLAFTALFAAAVWMTSCHYARQSDAAFKRWIGQQPKYVEVEVR